MQMLGGPGAGGAREGGGGGGWSRDRGERSGGAPRSAPASASRPAQPADTFEDDEIPF
jgi:single-strand DNA-binding protein